MASIALSASAALLPLKRKFVFSLLLQMKSNLGFIFNSSQIKSNRILFFFSFKRFNQEIRVRGVSYFLFHQKVTCHLKLVGRIDLLVLLLRTHRLEMAI